MNRFVRALYLEVIDELIESDEPFDANSVAARVEELTYIKFRRRDYVKLLESKMSNLDVFGIPKSYIKRGNKYYPFIESKYGFKPPTSSQAGRIFYNVRDLLGRFSKV